MSKYNSSSERKQPVRPDGKIPLVRGMEEQEVLLPSGMKRRLLVLDESKEKHKDFSIVFRLHEEVFPMDPASLGVFYYLATNLSDQYNVCLITISECARQAKKSRDTMAKWFAELQDAQYIKRVRDGVYMLNPHCTMQIRRQYLPILERAWRTGEVDKIKFEVAKLDAKIKEVTARNRQLVQDTKISAVPEAVTIPEIEALPPEERVPYIQQVKRGQRLLKELEKASQS